MSAKEEMFSGAQYIPNAVFKALTTIQYISAVQNLAPTGEDFWPKIHERGIQD